MEGKIEITGCDIKAFVKSVYRNSKPQGLGFLHAQEGELSDAVVDFILARPSDRILCSMDYVHVRACKMTVFKDGEKLFIPATWYDHSPSQLQRVLHECGISQVTA